MNNQTIAFLLLGAAALIFLGRRSGTSQIGTGAPQPNAGAPQPNAGAPQPNAGAPQQDAGVQQTSQAAGESTGNPPPDEVLEQAALYPDKAQLAGEWRYSWHAWNYYRAQAAIKAGLCDPPCAEYAPVLGERFGLTDSQGLTASEYHGYLSQSGVSGLSAWRYRSVYRRPWQ